jgi:hypothetical protein
MTSSQQIKKPHLDHQQQHPLVLPSEHRHHKTQHIEIEELDESDHVVGRYIRSETKTRGGEKGNGSERVDRIDAQVCLFLLLLISYKLIHSLAAIYLVSFTVMSYMYMFVCG